MRNRPKKPKRKPMAASKASAVNMPSESSCLTIPQMSPVQTVTLVNLPTELILIITESITAKKDLCSLSRTSRLLHEIIRPQLFSCQHFGQAWNRSRHGDNFDGFECRAPCLLLRTLMEDPTARDFIKTVRINTISFQYGNTEVSHIRERLNPLLEQDPEIGNYRQLLIRRKVLVNRTRFETLYLLLIIHNLQVLNLEFPGLHDDYRQRYLEMLQMAADPERPQSFHGFSGLRNLRIDFGGWNRQNNAPEISKLLCIPTLRYFTVRHARLTRGPDVWECPPRSSMIRYLYMDAEVDDGALLTQLLESFMGLVELRLHWGFILTLKQALHAVWSQRNSLSHLDLDIDELIPAGGSDMHIKGLKPYPHLRHLTLRGSDWLYPIRTSNMAKFLSIVVPPELLTLCLYEHFTDNFMHMPRTDEWAELISSAPFPALQSVECWRLCTRDRTRPPGSHCPDPTISWKRRGAPSQSAGWTKVNEYGEPVEDKPIVL